MGPRGRGTGPEALEEEVAPPQQEGPDQPRPPHPGKSRRQAPEVTREWPVDRPTPRPPAFPWPLVLMAGLLALVLMGLVPGLTTPVGLAVAASLTALSALAFRMGLKMEDPADQALRRAQRAIWLDEDPRVVIMRLRGVGLRGRLRRDIALRCLERARGATGWSRGCVGRPRHGGGAARAG